MSILSVLSILAAQTAFAGSLAYEDLVRILEDPARQVRSIDALLSQPELTATYRRGFTALYASRSLQGASPINPRIILFGEDAKLVLGFGCAPGNCLEEQTAAPGKDLPGSSSLELIHFREDTKSFEFRRIEFPENKPTGGVVISEANPKRCMGCHLGPDPRPNWESYFTWPGAYGGNDDHLSGALADGESMERLRTFIELAKDRPRYRALEDLAYGYGNGGARDRTEHNIDLTRELLQLNMSRLVDRISKTPHYQNLKFSLSAVSQGTGSFSGQLQAAGLTDLADLTERCVNPAYTTTPAPEFPSRVSQIVRLFFALGEPTLPWLLSFEPTLRSEAVSPADIDTDFWRELRRQDPSIDPGPGNADLEIANGWRRLALLPTLRNGILSCINAVGPARHPHPTRR